MSSATGTDGGTVIERMDLSLFYEPVRLLLGDLDSSVRRYPDATVAAGVRTACRVRLPGRYTVAPDGTAIVPEPDANGFALLSLHTALLFLVAQPEAESLKTRAVTLARRQGSAALLELKAQAWKLESGTCFKGWRDLHSWMIGMGGLPFAASLSQVEVETPFTTLYVTRGGATAAAGGGGSGSGVNPTEGLLYDAQGNVYRLAVATTDGVPQLELQPTVGAAAAALILRDADGHQFYARVVSDTGYPQLELTAA